METRTLSNFIQCPLCRIYFENLELLSTHVTFVHEQKNEFVCEFCNAKFKSIEILKNHLDASHHRLKGPFECVICLKQYFDENLLQAHTVQRHGFKENFQNFNETFPDEVMEVDVIVESELKKSPRGARLNSKSKQ